MCYIARSSQNPDSAMVGNVLLVSIRLGCIIGSIKLSHVGQRIKKSSADGQVSSVPQVLQLMGQH